MQSSEYIEAASAIRVAVVDDDPHVRSAIRYILQQSGDFSCSGCFANATAALNEIPHVRPDLVLMGIHMSGLNGIECTKQLKVMMPHLRIVVASGFVDLNSITESRRAGADNYLMKPISAGQCLATLRFTVFGTIGLTGRSPALTPGSRSELPAISLLTPRENQVMRCFAEGRPYKEVADKLGISYSTVHNYQHKIYQKLRVTNKTEAIAKWHQHCGTLSTPRPAKRSD